MIKPIEKDHFMYNYASTWCIFEYAPNMTFDEFVEFMDHIKSVCGDNVQELLVDTEIIPSKNWYWTWKMGTRHRQFTCYFTTDKQTTYYAMAKTLPFPETDKERYARMTANMHPNTGSKPLTAGKMFGASGPTSDQAAKLLGKIRARTAEARKATKK